MKKLLQEFQKICLEQFHFLETEFAFEIREKKINPAGAFVLYTNLTTAVRISCEPFDGGVFILLSRLINGQVPRYPIHLDQDTVLHSFDFNDLLALRKPDATVGPQEKEFQSRSQLEHVISNAAKALQEHVADVLGGNFQVFKKLDKIVKRRQELLTRSRGPILT